MLILSALHMLSGDTTLSKCTKFHRTVLPQWSYKPLARLSDMLAAGLSQACHRHDMNYNTRACERLVCAILLLYLARPVTGLLIIFA